MDRDRPTYITFTVEDDPLTGYIATALGFNISTEGDSLSELKDNVCEAVDCFFNEDDPARPEMIHLQLPQGRTITIPGHQASH